jgi:hypothetical protein
MRPPLKIREIWVWVIEHPDGSEGVPASGDVIPGHITPLLGADEARVRSLESHARSIAELTGFRLKLMRFTTAQIVETHP